MKKHNDNKVYITNKYNEVSFSNLTAKEADVFALILTKFKAAKDYKNSYSIEMTFEEIKKAAKIDHRIRYNEYPKMINELTDHLAATYGTLYCEEDETIEKFPIFVNQRISLRDRTVKFTLNERCIDMLDFVNGKYTAFSLTDFVRLKGIYTKRLYCALKQFDNTGRRIMYVDDLRQLLGYEGEYKKMKEKAIIPAMNRLRELDEFSQINMQEHKDGKVVKTVQFNKSYKTEFSTAIDDCLDTDYNADDLPF